MVGADPTREADAPRGFAESTSRFSRVSIWRRTRAFRTEASLDRVEVLEEPSRREKKRVMGGLLAEGFAVGFQARGPLQEGDCRWRQEWPRIWKKIWRPEREERGFRPQAATGSRVM